MTDLKVLRNQLGIARSAVDDRRARLSSLDRQLDEARRSGDTSAVSQLLARRGEADQELTKARNGFTAASHRFASEIGDARIFVDDAVAPAAEAPLPGVDEAVPIALLPVRLETRIRDGHLLIRIFPDDLHVDDHEPLLDDRELAAGQAYWSSVAAGGGDAIDGAWNLLATTVGTYRASWVRGQTQPGPAGTTPALALRPAGTARPAVARALPDLFVARIRTATGDPIMAPGRPLLDEVQVGMEWGGQPTDLLDQDDALQGGMAWMSDFATAVEAGLAIDVDLGGATSILDVTVVGVTVSLDPEASASLFGELIADHRVSRGAGIVAPGTPTNNLSDSPSGMDYRPPPATLDPAAMPAQDPRSDAVALSAALGLPIEALEALPGAASAAVAGQASMQRALFEATWGPYLRQFGVPAFKLGQLPSVYRHVTEYLRPGGPLPVVRLGKQPYGILPVLPAGAAATEDEPFLRWLTDFLPGVRDLWLSGRDDAPHGLDILGFEPASSRIRIRTALAQYSYRALVDTGIVEPNGVAGASDALLIAELGLAGTAIPSAARNFFAEATAPLRLPMAADGDTDFDVRDPKPKDATSVLGLLLRNAAVQVVDTAVNEQLAGANAVDPVTLARPLTATIPTLSNAAVSMNAEVSVNAPMTAAEKLAHTVTLDDGSTGTAAEWVAQLLGDGDLGAHPIDLGAYRARDAVRAFSASLGDIAALPVEQRALIAGQVIDSASHRYDAWVTSLATRRLSALRAATPTGIQLGAWGYVSGFTADELQAVPGRPGIVTDPRNRGWVLAPSIRHAATAGVLHAAWAEHGAGTGSDAFAVDLHSDRVRLALGLAQGMRQGQQLGALLGYRIERSLHEAFASRNVEADWLIFELRRQFPLRIRTLENASENVADERLVVNGWTLADEELASAGAVAAKLAPAIADAYAADSAAARPGLMAGATAALADAVAEAIGALDAFADLNLAEALYQLDGSNFERAAAATDAIGRAAPPPDAYDVASTPRRGTGIEQRLLLIPGTELRPPGYADSTPRALLAPRIDAFVAARLGPLDGLGVRVADWNGVTLATVPLAGLGLSALDLAADAARTAGPKLFPLLSAAAIVASGLPTTTPGGGLGDGVAAGIDLDELRDAAVLTLLRRAAAWHRALVGKRPLSVTSFSLQGASSTPPAPAGLADAVAAARAMLGPAKARWFGILAPDGAPLEQDVLRRAAAADAAANPIDAAAALFGEPPVLEATATVPQSIQASAADQAALGVSEASVAGWLQDSARVRDAARELDEAILLDELAGGQQPAFTAAQEPVFPYREATPATRAWVGSVQLLPLGEAAVTSIVTVGSGSLDGEVTGIELDAWSEVVPDRIAPGAVTANLAAPNSRAPNTILLGVSGNEAWTRSGLFSLVDEALELAECRLVDLDAAKRIPRLLPAIFLSDYDEDDARPWREILEAVDVPTARWRWTAAGS